MGVAVLWLLAAVLLTLFLLVRRPWDKNFARIRHCGAQIPGPRTLPLLGNILDFAIDINEVINLALKLRENYGNLFRLWAGPTDLVVAVSDPQDAEALLCHTKNIKKAFNYDFLRPWIGTGLLTATGEKWHTRRKIITPTFHFKILEQFIHVFNKQGDVFVSELRKKAGEGYFDICPYIDLFTQDVICESAMGVDLKSQTGEGATSYLQAVHEESTAFLMRSSRPWLYPDYMYKLSSFGRRGRNNLKILHGMTEEVIRRRKKRLLEDHVSLNGSVDDAGKKRRLAFLDLLLLYGEDGKVLSDADIREEVDTFMFEGHDTTSSAISCALMELSRRQEIQEKILHELEEITNKKTGDLHLSMDALNNAKYLERVIKEVLRMYPSVPVLARTLTHDLQLATVPVTVPPGVTAVLLVYLLHRNPDVYPDPDEFNPDNFLPENVSQRHLYAFLPFSAGPRNCIGQKFAMLEMKSVLAKIIWNFSLEADPDYTPKVTTGVTLKLHNGAILSVSFRKRQ